MKVHFSSKIRMMERRFNGLDMDVIYNIPIVPQWQTAQIYF